MYIDRRTCPGTVCSAPAPFRLQNFPFTCGDLTPPHLIHGSLIPNGITIGSAAFAGLFIRAHSCDRLTDRPRYSVCSNRPRLANAARRPKKMRCPSPTPWNESYLASVRTREKTTGCMTVSYMMCRMVGS